MNVFNGQIHSGNNKLQKLFFGFNVSRVRQRQLQKTVFYAQGRKAVMARRLFRYFLEHIKGNLARQNFPNGQTGNFRFCVKNIVFGNPFRLKDFFQGYSGLFGLSNQPWPVFPWPINPFFTKISVKRILLTPFRHFSS